MLVKFNKKNYKQYQTHKTPIRTYFISGMLRSNILSQSHKQKYLEQIIYQPGQESNLGTQHEGSTGLVYH